MTNVTVNCCRYTTTYGLGDLLHYKSDQVIFCRIACHVGEVNSLNCDIWRTRPVHGISIPCSTYCPSMHSYSPIKRKVHWVTPNSLTPHVWEQMYSMLASYKYPMPTLFVRYTLRAVFSEPIVDFQKSRHSHLVNDLDPWYVSLTDRLWCQRPEFLLDQKLAQSLGPKRRKEWLKGWFKHDLFFDVSKRWMTKMKSPQRLHTDFQKYAWNEPKMTLKHSRSKVFHMTHFSTHD